MLDALQWVAHATLTTPFVVIFHEATRTIGVVAPEPAPASSGNTQLLGWAALIASCTGFLAAAGTILLGWQKKRGEKPNDDIRDKAMKYLMEQNRALLKERQREDKKNDDDA